MVQKITPATDIQTLIRVNNNFPLIIIDAYASWCGPCRVLAPRLEEMEKKYGNRVRFYKVDVDECPRIADRYHIASLPTILFIKNGVEIERITGCDPTKIERTIEKHLFAQNR